MNDNNYCYGYGKMIIADRPNEHVCPNSADFKLKGSADYRLCTAHHVMGGYSDTKRAKAWVKI